MNFSLAQALKQVLEIPSPDESGGGFDRDSFLVELRANLQVWRKLTKAEAIRLRLVAVDQQLIEGDFSVDKPFQSFPINYPSARKANAQSAQSAIAQANAQAAQSAVAQANAQAQELAAELDVQGAADPLPRISFLRWATATWMKSVAAELRTSVAVQRTEALQNVVRAAGLGVWRLDLASSEFSGDAVVAQLLQWPGKAVLADFAVVKDFFSARSQVDWQYEINKTAKHGMRGQCVLQLQPASEPIKWLSASFELAASDEEGQIIGLLRDHSEVRKAELELELHHEQLERMVKELRKSNRIDPLTGVANRIALSEKFRLETLSAHTRNSWLSVLMIDVDHFKPYNDQFGHAAGDLALKKVGQILLATVQGEDLAARFGGEEFCVLSLQEPAGAKSLAEKIRAAIADAQWELRAVTVSIGVQSLRGVAVDEKQLFHDADAALYRAKAAGRNRCEVH